MNPKIYQNKLWNGSQKNLIKYLKTSEKDLQGHELDDLKKDLHKLNQEEPQEGKKVRKRS